MGIRDKLAEQEAKYISLRELLTQMSTEGDCSIQEAATFLERCLEERSRGGRKTPRFFQFEKVSGWKGTPSNPWDAARTALAVIAETGDLNKASINNSGFDDEIPF